MYSAVTATIAIFLTIINLWLLNEHNKKSFRPYLLAQINMELAKGIIQIYLVNKGVGPAIISEYKFELRGEEIDTKDHRDIRKKLLQASIELAKEKCINPPKINIQNKQIYPYKEVLAPGDTLPLITLTSNNFKFINDLLSDFEMNFTYESIYEVEQNIKLKTFV